MDAVVFFGCAAIILAGALGVVIARNPVHSALFLVMTMITIAVLFLQLQAPLVAIVQIVVYASAIVVLFLFVIMLLGVDKHETLDDPGHRFQRPAALVLGVVAFVGLVALTTGRWQLGAKQSSGRGINDRGDEIRPLARTLFTHFAWPFEVTAVLLVIAVIGAVVLARRSSRTQDLPASSELERR
jgi:NADH-quinone oxidoreductase subunit J